MESGYEKYLGEGTRKMMEIVASTDIGYDERRFIVDSFTDELVKNLSGVGDDSDYEHTLYNASIRYIDLNLTKGMSNEELSFEECEGLIKLCRRQRKLLSLFGEKSWTLQRVDNKGNKLDYCEDYFLKKQEYILIREKLLEADEALSVGLENARGTLSISNCEKAQVLLQKMEDAISECEQKGFTLPSVHNWDIKKADREIAYLKGLAKRRDDLYKEIIDNDSKMHDLLSLHDDTIRNDMRVWREIIKLSDQQQGLLDDCHKNGWDQPVLEYDDLTDILSRFMHYISMQDLDGKIVVMQNMFHTKKVHKRIYKDFYNKCALQERNIEKCEKKKWLVPNLTIATPSEISETIHRKKRKSDVLRGVLIAAILAIVTTISALLSVYLYTKDKTQIPISLMDALEEKYYDVYRQFEEAGFDNIVTKEDKTGWLPDKQVISVTIGGTSEFKKDAWVNPDERVEITYSSEGRIDVGKILDNWREMGYEEIGETFLEAGFTNVICSQEYTYKKDYNMQTTIILNGNNYTDGVCYIPIDAPIVITRYILKIKIGKSNVNLVGEIYTKIVNELKDQGFTNIKCSGNKELILGLLKKEGTIEKIMIDGFSVFSSTDEFVYNVPIEIEYNSRCW